MKFRILKNADNQYKVQRKGWLFWHNVGCYVFGPFGSLAVYVPQIVNSQEEAERIIEECERELRQRKWHEVAPMPPISSGD